MNEQVTEYIEAIKVAWQKPIAEALRQAVFQAIPDVEEKLQYSKPHYRKNNQYAAVIGTAKGWVSFTIFNAQDVETPQGMFEASENGDRKTIKIMEGQAVDYALIGKLLKQAASTL